MSNKFSEKGFPILSKIFNRLKNLDRIKGGVDLARAEVIFNQMHDLANNEAYKSEKAAQENILQLMKEHVGEEEASHYREGNNTIQQSYGGNNDHSDGHGNGGGSTGGGGNNNNNNGGSNTGSGGGGGGNNNGGGRNGGSDLEKYGFPLPRYSTPQRAANTYISGDKFDPIQTLFRYDPQALNILAEEKFRKNWIKVML